MGIVKQHIAEEEGKQQIAVDLLKKTGYLASCEYHEHITFTIGGDEEVKGAYKLAMSRWEQDFKGSFKDARELTDAIKATSENSDYGNDGCEICRGLMDKD